MSTSVSLLKGCSKCPPKNGGVRFLVTTKFWLACQIFGISGCSKKHQNPKSIFLVLDQLSSKLIFGSGDFKEVGRQLSRDVTNFSISDANTFSVVNE